MSLKVQRTALAALVAIALAVGCNDRPDDLAMPAVAPPSAEATAHRVDVHMPASLSSLGSGMTDHQGRPVGVSCATCHSLRDHHELPRSVEELGAVHGGLELAHGSLSCGSCHHPEAAERLRLADETSLEMVEAMTLCAQCHGPQARDWAAGTHGGIRGHWDRRMGPATRNHCVDCHDPHAPAFPSFLPAPPPRDRFLGRTNGGTAHES